MYGSIFHFDLGRDASPRDRWRWGLSLAEAIDAVSGFVAFIALESEDGALAGLCICVDAASLAEAGQVAEAWQRAHGGQAGSAMKALIAGEVIVQRGF